MLARVLALSAGLAAALRCGTAFAQNDQAIPSAPSVTRDAGRYDPANSRPPAWLERLNHYRTMADLKLVSENPEFSRGAYLHARYMVENKDKRYLRTSQMHSEDATNPWFTPEGALAASRSNLRGPGIRQISGNESVDRLISVPFHRFSMLEPSLLLGGYGQYQRDGWSASALYLVNVRDVPIPWSLEDVPLQSEARRRYSTPVIFPPGGATISLRVFNGGEWPNPLSACESYRAPVGLALTLQLGIDIGAKLRDYLVTENGIRIEACGFDAESYKSSRSEDHDTARRILHDYGAVVVIPRRPLRAGHSYHVKMTVNDREYAWSFSVVDEASAASSAH